MKSGGGVGINRRITTTTRREFCLIRPMRLLNYICSPIKVPIRTRAGSFYQGEYRISCNSVKESTI